MVVSKALHFSADHLDLGLFAENLARGYFQSRSYFQGYTVVTWIIPMVRVHTQAPTLLHLVPLHSTHLNDDASSRCNHLSNDTK